MPDDLETEPPLPRVAVHVSLHSVSRDLQKSKPRSLSETRSQILRLALGCLGAVLVALLLIR
jgi:hypothetical protein